MQTIDFQILDWIQANCRCGLLDFLMPKITLLGSKGIVWIALGLVFLLVRKHRRAGASILAGLICELLIGNVLLKNLFRRPRPCWINTDINMLVPVPQDYSFPSGHTMACFITAVILLKYDKRIGIPVLVIASLVAFSRLYLYVHFPTDVLAGAVLGVVIGLLMCRVLRPGAGKKAEIPE